MKNQFELVIFDCDGVLVDSERISNQVFADILRRECNLDFSLTDMFETFVGHSSAQCMSKVEEILGRKPPDNLEQMYRSEIDNVLAHSVVAVPGVANMLQKLSIPCCVASNGPHEKIQMTLGRTNLLQHFEDRIFSAMDVDQGKPSPDVYLHAAKMMGISDMSDCLVVEDTPIGVAAGAAAGMHVFGYSGMMSEQRLDQAGANLTFNNMDCLLDNITNYGTLR